MSSAQATGELPVTPRPPTATIRDVARRAGVSTATVSRVLAGIGNHRSETIAAVRSAAEELDYRPSAVARSLRIRRTRTLGLVITDIRNPFFPDLVQAADVAARAAGYSILLGSAAYDEERALHYLDLMVDGRVDGVIIASSQVSAPSWRRLLASPVPVVVVNAEPVGQPVSVITSDNHAGARIAAEHLIELGHRRIAYVRGSESFTAERPRLEGFREACRAAGLAPADTPEFPGEGQFESGERAARQLLDDGCNVTAIACYNDMTAIGVLRTMLAAGRRVPEDVSVIGFDDIAAAAWVAPALTTLAQQKAEMGRLAVGHLARALEDPDHDAPVETVRLPMTLIQRETTAPPPSHRP